MVRHGGEVLEPNYTPGLAQNKPLTTEDTEEEELEPYAGLLALSRMAALA
jgi:hypothetical protein